MPPENVTEVEVLPDVSTELATVSKQHSLEPETAASLQKSFAPLFHEAHDIISESRKVVVTDSSQKLKIAQAGLYRKALKAKRIAAEKLKDELKRDSLRKSNAVQGFYNIFLHLTSAEEKRLQEQEDFAARQEAERKAALKTSREEALRPYGLDTSFYQLGEMSDEAWTQLLENTQAADTAKKEQARRAEEEKIRLENERLKEEQRLREENARLQREAQEKAEALRKEREAAEAALKAEQAAAAKARAEAEAKAKAEREAAELVLKAEKAKRDAELAAEREKARAAQALAAEAARQEKLRLQALAEVERQKKETARRAASAPDREKAHSVAKSVREIALPDMTTESGKAFVESVRSSLASFAAQLDTEAESL